MDADNVLTWQKAAADGTLLNGEKKQRIPSVTTASGDANFDFPGGASGGADMLMLHVGGILDAAGAADGIPPWSYAPMARDRALRSFYRREPILKGAVNAMVARARALNFSVIGPPRAKAYAQDILEQAALRQGIRALLGKSTLDWLTTDNGMFWELVAPGNPLKPIKGKLVPPYLLPLDSTQCWRTLDEEFPVVYVNPLTGKYHRLHYTRVLFDSNMPQNDELARSIGFCATSRALEYAQFMRDVLTYKREKITGKFNRGLLLVNGINAQQLRDADTSALENNDAPGMTVYRGITTIARAGGNPIDAKLVDLASLPDGFDTERDMTLYVYTLALAFGVDAREFWPATSSGATRADASIQDYKAQVKGIGDMVSSLEGLLRRALPDTLEIEADYRDDEADLRRAQIDNLRTTTLTTIRSSGGMTDNEYRAHLIREDVLDAELLETLTPTQDNAAPLTDISPTRDGEASESPTPPPNVDAVRADQPQAMKHRKDYENAADSLSAFLLTDAPTSDGAAARQTFIARMRNALKSAGETAYEAGLRDGGIKRPLNSEDRARLSGWLASQQEYVMSYARAVGETGAVNYDESAREVHAEMWINKSLYDAYYLGFREGALNKRVRWQLGIADHCEDCLRYSGQVHTLAEWEAMGARPKSSVLACGGFNCKCNFEYPG